MIYKYAILPVKYLQMIVNITMPVTEKKRFFVPPNLYQVLLEKSFHSEFENKIAN